MHLRITRTAVTLLLGVSFAVTTTAAPPSPSPSPRPQTAPMKPQPTPVRQDDTLPGKVAPGPAAQGGATTAPQGPGKSSGQPKPQNMLPDLAITNANQTSPDFFVVRIKNAGNADSAATTLSGAVNVPKGGSFPAGTLPFSVPVPPIAAGKLTDVNVKTSKTHKGNVISFNVNAKQAFKEISFNNNMKILTANPAYP